MPTNTNTNKKFVDLSGLDSFLSSVESNVEKLLRITRSLPKVNEDGHSECRSAEQLYADKEEIQSTVQAQYKQLHEYLKAVDDEIKRCKNNLVVISANEEKINLDEVRKHYSDAEVKLASQYKRYIRMRDDIQRTIKLVDKAIQEAASKRFPGKISERWPGKYSAHQETPTDINSGKPSPSSLGTELDEMLDSGPIQNARNETQEEKGEKV